MIACPTGGAEVAHQIVNTGRGVDDALPGVSTRADLDACEYPDFGEGVDRVGPAGGGSEDCFARGPVVDYYDGEEP